MLADSQAWHLLRTRLDVAGAIPCLRRLREEARVVPLLHDHERDRRRVLRIGSTHLQTRRPDLQAVNRINCSRCEIAMILLPSLPEGGVTACQNWSGLRSVMPVLKHVGLHA